MCFLHCWVYTLTNLMRTIPYIIIQHIDKQLLRFISKWSYTQIPIWFGPLSYLLWLLVTPTDPKRSSFEPCQWPINGKTHTIKTKEPGLFPFLIIEEIAPHKSSRYNITINRQLSSKLPPQGNILPKQNFVEMKWQKRDSFCSKFHKSSLKRKGKKFILVKFCQNSSTKLYEKA